MKKIFKSTTLILLVITILMSISPMGVLAIEAEWEEYELRILTFEDEGNDTYWSSLIADPQYSDPILYGDTTNESGAYKWHDAGNTELSHTLPFNYGAYNYWGGGHAISNYSSTDFETYGDFMSQLTVFSSAEYNEGVVMRAGGGNNGSNNFAVHFGYADNSGYNGTENLPALIFADGKARVIDHMYVNNTTYLLNCAIFGNGFTAPLDENNGLLKIIATGYNCNEKTNTVEFELINMENGTIVLDWTPWELSGLGEVTKVEFNMAGSSDNGYGFSQPAYFAYDDVAVRFKKPSVSDIYVSEAEAPNTYDYCYYVAAPEIVAGKAIIALYSGEKLVGMETVNILNGDNDVYGSIVTNEKPTQYKIMLWDGMGTMKPLYGAIKGDIN